DVDARDLLETRGGGDDLPAVVPAGPDDGGVRGSRDVLVRGDPEPLRQGQVPRVARRRVLGEFEGERGVQRYCDGGAVHALVQEERRRGRAGHGGTLVAVGCAAGDEE